MNREGQNPSTKNKREPLFIKFANFHFSNETIDNFFRMLKDEGVDVPLEELFINYRPEDEEYINGPPFLTEVDKEKVSKDLESDQEEFKELLSNFANLDKEHNFDPLLDIINPYLSEGPVQIIRKEDLGKLELALPSLEDVHVEEGGWDRFILALVAIDLAKYLMGNPVRRIRLCPDCKKFFTHSSLKAKFCSEDCHDSYHRKRYGKEYFGEHVKEHRRLKKEKRGTIV